MKTVLDIIQSLDSLIAKNDETAERCEKECQHFPSFKLPPPHTICSCAHDDELKDEIFINITRISHLQELQELQ